MLTSKTITDSKGNTVIIATDRDITYYIKTGAKLVCMTYDNIEEGTDIERVRDFDVFTWNEPINTPAELEEAVNF